MITIKPEVNRFNKKYMETKKILGNHKIKLKEQIKLSYSQIFKLEKI